MAKRKRFSSIAIQQMDEMGWDLKGGKRERQFFRPKKEYAVDDVYALKLIPFTPNVAAKYEDWPMIPFLQAFLRSPFETYERNGEQVPKISLYTCPDTHMEKGSCQFTAWMNDYLQDLPGYFGGPEVHEHVQIFRSFFQVDNPTKVGAVRLNSGDMKNAMRYLRSLYPNKKEYPQETLQQWANSIRTVENNLFSVHHWMIAVRVSVELDADGKSIPLTEKPQIFDCHGMFKSGMFGPKESLWTKALEFEKNHTKAKAEHWPTDVPDYLYGDDEEASYDILISPYNTRVGNTDTVGYRCRPRAEKTLLAREGFYDEENVPDLFEIAEEGHKYEKAIAIWMGHFGLIGEEEYLMKYAEEEEEEEVEGTEGSEEKVETSPPAEKKKKKKKTKAKVETPAKEEEEEEESEEALLAKLEKIKKKKEAGKKSSKPAPPPPEVDEDEEELEL